MGGMTALLFAARDGQIDAARALLECGADINQVSASEKTSPLVMAIMNGHLDLAKLLIDWGADPNLANNQGLTAALRRGRRPVGAQRLVPGARHRRRKKSPISI